MKPTVALVGRPNVGKSTLFNRLSTRKKAIVHDQPGVTRDRKYADGRIGPVEFTVIDTPGLEEALEGSIEYGMTEQTISAIRMADVVCLVIDGFVGVTPQDKVFAQLIRKNHNNVILLVNKCEKNITIDGSYMKLGFGIAVPISAEHGLGMADLCTELLEKLPDHDDMPDPFKENKIQIAITGRPNSGKSTFINALLKENRVLTGPEAGITRDSISIEWEYRGQPITLVDTAGLRKKGNITESLEKLSASDTIGSIKYANTVVLMLDATRALEQQDLSIANFIIGEGRSLVIAINKWDLVEKKKAFKEELDYKLSMDLSQVEGVPVVYLSALSGENLHKVIDACLDIYKTWNKKISTPKLNDWLAMAIDYHMLPLQKNGRRLRIKYCAQINTRPPKFKFFCNKADAIPDSYKRYLMNSLRENFAMQGVPIRMDFVSSENPYGK
jgi:GTP-binding protein